jgi:hypothetical protein
MPHSAVPPSSQRRATNLARTRSGSVKVKTRAPLPRPIRSRMRGEHGFGGSVDSECVLSAECQTSHLSDLVILARSHSFSVLASTRASFEPCCRLLDQSSSASRFTTGAFGFLLLTQCRDRPELYGESRRFETIPSARASIWRGAGSGQYSGAPS